MTLGSSFLLAKSLIFPKAEKKSSARRSLWGALLCIGLSIIPLIVVISITNGMIEGMTERIIGLASSHVQAFVAQNIDETKTLEGLNSFASLLQEENPEVISVYPEVNISALATANNYKTGIQIRGMKDDIFETNHYFKKLFEVQEGNLSEFGANNVVMGSKIAQLLGLHSGDTFRVITTRTVNGMVAPKLTSFKVCAIISSGYQELDALWCFIPIQTAYKSLSMDNAKYTIMLETKDAFSPEVVKLQKNLQSKHGRIANFYRWDKIHQSEFESFSSTKVLLIFIMMLIVLVASINISSAIIMLVIERQKEIAILKSLGATPTGITLAFLLTAAACGAGGLIIGLPIGLLLSVNANALIKFIENAVNAVAKIGWLISGTPVDQITKITFMDPAYYLQNIPVNIPYNQILLIAVSTLLLSILVSLIPSIKAGKEKPLDILRKG